MSRTDELRALAQRVADSFPPQVSEVVLFLASDASALLTAAQIPADKGYMKV